MCVFQHVEALQKAQAEIQRLHREREHYEDSMKKAFMRGVCALNIEALSMFHTGDTGRQEQGKSDFLSKKFTKTDTGPYKYNICLCYSRHLATNMLGGLERGGPELV